MKPPRDRFYLAFIRSLPCCVPGCRRGRIHAAHTGPHGLGQRSSDYSAIPLCAWHHVTGPQSYHRLGPVRFEQVHGINIRQIIRRLNRKPEIRMENGWFIGYLDGVPYRLEPVSSGIERSLKQMRRHYREALAS